MQKKILLSAVLLAFSVMGIAQSSKYQSASNYFKTGDFDKAKAAIDAASVHEKTNKDPRTWNLKGNIYKTLASIEDEKFASLQEGAIDEAITSYKKALEFLPNSKRITEQEIRIGYSEMIPVISNAAINAYNGNDFPTASMMFEKQAMVSADFGQMDTSAYYNAGIAAAQTGDNDRAISMYQKVLPTGYNGASLYYEIARLQIEGEKTDEALATIAEGKGKYPGDKNLLLLETNIYLQDESKMGEAITNLNSAIEADPTNPSLYYARGALYQKNPETIENAKADFQKCIELDPEHFEANYNLGAMFVNRSGEIQEEMNALDFSEQKKYDELKTQRDELFKAAIAPLEKALAIRPDEKVVQATLLELYGKTGATDKYNEMKAKIGG